MDLKEVDTLVQQLAAGFEALQDEYQKLHGQHRALERKLGTARKQYNELAKLYGDATVTTPPLSLSSSPKQRHTETTATQTVADILEQEQSSASQGAAERIGAASKAADVLREGIPAHLTKDSNGVKIWSGPSADQAHEGGSTLLPSISESPLEQDFTIEGVPSKLGCPFATMAKKKLSSHAASVLSRYNQGSAGAARSSQSSVSRINGKESLLAKRERRASGLVDPIKAEICGLSDHDEEGPYSERALKSHVEQPENAEVGVCPIRFLDQHSPEEVATYFERHKHELPRSHEVCVKRYQSNEKQIQELDEKYGNLVSMIQGLGAKHKELLPQEAVGVGEEVKCDAGNEGVRKWATSVADGMEAGEDRQARFERPLREVRVGESPSRPWGIHVPAEYAAKEEGSHASSRAAQIASAPLDTAGADREPDARCPFGLSEPLTAAPQMKAGRAGDTPAFIKSAGDGEARMPSARNPPEREQRMVFTGPVFIGYNADDAAKILREGGFGGG